MSYFLTHDIHSPEQPPPSPTPRFTTALLPASYNNAQNQPSAERGPSRCPVPTTFPAFEGCNSPILSSTRQFHYRSGKAQDSASSSSSQLYLQSTPVVRLPLALLSSAQSGRSGTFETLETLENDSLYWCALAHTWETERDARRKQDLAWRAPEGRIHLTTDSSYAQTALDLGRVVHDFAGEEYFANQEVMELVRSQKTITTPSFERLEDNRHTLELVSVSRDKIREQYADETYIKRHTDLERYEKREQREHTRSLQKMHDALEDRVRTLATMDHTLLNSLDESWFAPVPLVDFAKLTEARNEGDRRRQAMIESATALLTRLKGVLGDELKQQKRKKPPKSAPSPISQGSLCRGEDHNLATAGTEFRIDVAEEQGRYERQRPRRAQHGQDDAQLEGGDEESPGDVSGGDVDVDAADERDQHEQRDCTQHEEDEHGPTPSTGGGMEMDTVDEQWDDVQLGEGARTALGT
ncbi:hypothetical protein FA13DRAFT_1799690 [Coprinellus micaceus]|uniref:Uncharacterized protein n=1 Tax=Coprinellus micaceus TaxID=71717 RepID=A0A4Y7SIM6_COPMI|nr:hypothetical protein FA13DRAFT_1799690 [Coprinellus micaceus]